MNLIELTLTKAELETLKRGYCVEPSTVESSVTIKNVSLNQSGVHWVRIATRNTKEYFAAQDDVDAALYPSIE